MVLNREDEKPRDAKDEGVEGVDDRVYDVQVCEGEGGEGVAFVETRGEGDEGDGQDDGVYEHGEL